MALASQRKHCKGSESQQRDIDTGGKVVGPILEDVVEMANTMANCAWRIAKCKVRLSE
jgi:hypothetical protein